MYTLDDARKKFEESLLFFRDELSKLRTGRATPALVDHIVVEAYGSKSPLKNLSSISAPDARTIIIQPWDKSILRDIEKALSVAELNVSPIVEGSHVRLSLPSLNEENRRNLVKLLRQMEETGKVTLRQQREKVKSEIDAKEKNAELTEDQKFKFHKQLDGMISEYNLKIREISEKKETEIMTI